MNPNDNPFLKPTDYYEGYKENIDKLKDNPLVCEFDKICYELFGILEQGKEFLKVVEKRFLIPALAQRGSPSYAIDCIWADGFKDAFRHIIQCVESHNQRIKAEMNKQ